MTSNFEHKFSDQKQLIGELSETILKNLEHAIEKRGRASLIVSGGSTPKPLFEQLRKSDLPWEKVTVGLCDERWVDTSKEESNENFVKKYLLQEKASNAHFVGMYCEDVELDEAQKHCSETFMKELSPIDVLILGMGTDAHTASLFPENSRLGEAFDLKNRNFCIAIEPDTAPFKRMSLTLWGILSARHIYLHFEGEEKRSVYEEAISGDDIYSMPIRSVLQQVIKKIEVFYR